MFCNFSPADFQVKVGDHVIVETARGIEYGSVVQGIREVADDKVIMPLKSVIRIATEEDDKKAIENNEKEKKAFKICKEKIVYLSCLSKSNAYNFNHFCLLVLTVIQSMFIFLKFFL